MREPENLAGMQLGRLKFALFLALIFCNLKNGGLRSLKILIDKLFQINFHHIILALMILISTSNNVDL